MENRSHALLAGLFVILLGAALLATGVWFQRETVGEQVRYVLETRSSVSGLNPQAAVRYRGLQIGKVQDLRVDPDNPAIILVEVSVDRDIPLTTATYGRLEYQGLTGLAYVQLNTDDKAGKARRLDPDAARPPRIELRGSMMEELGGGGAQLLGRMNDVAGRLSRVLSDDNIERLTGSLARLDQTMAQVGELAQSARAGAAAAPAVAADLRAALQRANTTLAEVSGLAAEARSRLAKLDHLGDAAAGLAKSGERLAASGERVGAAAERLAAGGDAVAAQVVDSTLPRAEQLLDDLAKSARELDRLLADLDRAPNSLIFGAPAVRPGPGEAGFKPPEARP